MNIAPSQVFGTSVCTFGKAADCMPMPGFVSLSFNVKNQFPCIVHGRIQSGGAGGRTALKNQKKIKGILAILVQIPCKITKLQSQHSMLGNHRPASEALFKSSFVCGLMMANL